MMRLKKRAERRQRSLRAASWRRTFHLRQTHGNDKAGVDCVCELANFYFEKRSVGCGCSKKRAGQPRGAGGKASWRYDVIGRPDRVFDKSFSGRWVLARWGRGYGCKDGYRVRIYKWRRQDRDFCRSIVNGRLDKEAVESPHKEK